ncbi:MAG TPA: tetratricopeptide repeat protein [Gemmatimonadaceae bacterium]|nr:tetratricopeptide repeat protein [Gemmatimonadaceae bacterium]
MYFASRPRAQAARTRGLRDAAPRRGGRLSRLSRCEDAEAYYGSALALAHELGMRPLAAHCHLGLGKLYRRTGKREQAREHVTTATSMYHDMGMTFWLEKAEAAAD